MDKLPKQFKKAWKESTKADWTWVKKTKHIEVRNADGEFVVMISTTMYDGALTKRIMSVLRKNDCPGA